MSEIYKIFEYAIRLIYSFNSKSYNHTSSLRRTGIYIIFLIVFNIATFVGVYSLLFLSINIDWLKYFLLFATVSVISLGILFYKKKLIDSIVESPTKDNHEEQSKYKRWSGFYILLTLITFAGVYYYCLQEIF